MKHIYILFLTLVFITCTKQDQNTKNGNKTVVNNNKIQITKAQFNNQNMQLGQLTEQAFVKVIKVTGMVDVPPENKASVSTFIGGYVNKIPLLIGDKVTKGQLVASITNTKFVDLQQEYIEITAQLTYLKNEFDRQKTLFDEKITSQRNYLKVESSYKSSLAKYQGLQQKLQMLHINPTTVKQGNIASSINLYAPISGYITKVNVSNGSFISSEAELLEIINTDHIHLELDVFEKDILQVKKHQSIQFKVSEASDKNFDAEVHLVGTSINKDRTIKVHAHIKNEENTNFIVGMFVEATIITNTRNAVSIDKSALIKKDDTFFVLVVNQESELEYTLQKIKLDIGSENENFVEVVHPELLKDRRIITKGVFMLSEI